MDRRQFIFGALTMIAAAVKGQLVTADMWNQAFAGTAQRLDSIATLRSQAAPSGPATVVLDGYATAGDGGGGVFIWSATAANADDGGTIIAPSSNPATGRWLRVFTGGVQLKWFGAKADKTTDDTAAIQTALNSGAQLVLGGGLSYKVTALTVPANVVFDGQGGALLTAGATNQSVVTPGGTWTTVQNWFIGSITPGTWMGMYGVNVTQNNMTLRNLRFQDITYSAVMNNAFGTRGYDLYASNCGWDLLSNYTSANDGYFKRVKSVGCGRSMASTDVGATGIVVDGFECIDNGLDSVSNQHKDCLHFEGAVDCVFKNGVIRYTSAYAQGTISQTWAMMRWNNATNCVIENVDIKVASTVHNQLLLGLVDSGSGQHNTNCAAKNINVDATAVSSFNLQVVNYDGAAAFKIDEGLWRGEVTIVGGSAGIGISSIKNIEVDGTGTGTFLSGSYIAQNIDISDCKIKGFPTAFNLPGFQNSTIKDCVIDGASTCVFSLLNTNASGTYQPNGGVIANNTIRGTTGTVLNTNNQQSQALLFASNTIDCSPSVGLNASGGTAGATTANVKAIGNIVNGTITTVTSAGTNSAGALNANMNNVAT